MRKEHLQPTLLRPLPLHTLPLRRRLLRLRPPPRVRHLDRVRVRVRVRARARARVRVRIRGRGRGSAKVRDRGRDRDGAKVRVRATRVRSPPSHGRPWPPRGRMPPRRRCHRARTCSATYLIVRGGGRIRARPFGVRVRPLGVRHRLTIEHAEAQLLRLLRRLRPRLRLLFGQPFRLRRRRRLPLGSLLRRLRLEQLIEHLHTGASVVCRCIRPQMAHPLAFICTGVYPPVAAMPGSTANQEPAVASGPLSPARGSGGSLPSSRWTHSGEVRSEEARRRLARQRTRRHWAGRRAWPETASSASTEAAAARPFARRNCDRSDPSRLISGSCYSATGRVAQGQSQQRPGKTRQSDYECNLITRSQ